MVSPFGTGTRTPLVVNPIPHSLVTIAHRSSAICTPTQSTRSPGRKVSCDLIRADSQHKSLDHQPLTPITTRVPFKRLSVPLIRVILPSINPPRKCQRPTFLVPTVMSASHKTNIAHISGKGMPPLPYRICVRPKKTTISIMPCIINDDRGRHLLHPSLLRGTLPPMPPSVAVLLIRPR